MVKHAAIKRTDGVIATGRSHPEIIRKSPKGTCKTNNRNSQGFTDDKGNFISRLEAKEEAYRCGQIPKVHYDLINSVGLISENLWSDNNFKYCETKGYYKD